MTKGRFDPTQPKRLPLFRSNSMEFIPSSLLPKKEKQKINKEETDPRRKALETLINKRSTKKDLENRNILREIPIVAEISPQMERFLANRPTKQMLANLHVITIVENMEERKKELGKKLERRMDRKDSISITF
jgi:hypothetical protein